MSNKELIIKRLLEKKSITEDEAVILLKKEIVEVVKEVPAPEPFDPFMPMGPAQPFYQRPPFLPYIKDNRKKSFFETCPCNPANGGDGLCGCTMGREDFITTCSSNS
jgi:hypothetical protein